MFQFRYQWSAEKNSFKIARNSRNSFITVFSLCLKNKMKKFQNRKVDTQKRIRKKEIKREKSHLRAKNITEQKLKKRSSENFREKDIRLQ